MESASDSESVSSESEVVRAPKSSSPAAAEFGSSSQPSTLVPMSASVFDAYLRLNRLQQPKMVENPVEDMLNPPRMQLNHLFVPPRIGMTPQWSPQLLLVLWSSLTDSGRPCRSNRRSAALASFEDVKNHHLVQSRRRPLWPSVQGLCGGTMSGQCQIICVPFWIRLSL